MTHEENFGVVTLDYSIRESIITIRDTQVILDSSIARLYGVSTKALNQAVKRNKSRFPNNFMFQLTKKEFDILRSQNVTSNWGGVRYCPYAFTEHGVVMLATILKSTIAIEMSVRVVNAFVAMKQLFISNSSVFERIDNVEHKILTTNIKLNEVLKRLNTGEPPLQGVFFEGQLWDACSLVEKLIARAKKTILLIDNWVSIETLDMLAKKGCGVEVTIVTSKRGNKLAASDISKFNTQYPTLIIKESAAFHDRFLILDNKELYLIGASLKDLGKKCFAFTKMDGSQIQSITARV